MITRLHAKGYKSLKDLDLELRPLNVMIGPNGSGKSNVIDSLVFLAEGAEGPLGDALLRRGGGTVALWSAESIGAAFVLGLRGLTRGDRARGHEQPTDYSYVTILTVLDTAIEVGHEELVARGIGPDGADKRILYATSGEILMWEGREREDTVVIGDDDLAISALRNPWDTADWVRQKLLSSRRYAGLSTGSRSPIRLPQPPRQEAIVSPDGDNLVSVLHAAESGEAREDFFKPVIEALMAAFPGFQDIRFPPDGGEGHIGLRWHIDGRQRGFTPTQLSDGTLRFLWLLAILHQPPTGGIIMIEEPEIGLHPDLIRILAETLKSVASEEKQFLISTHSPELVSWLEPEDVLVVEKDEEGATQARRLDREGLGAWLDSYTLGELWRMGEVGGRPW